MGPEGPMETVGVIKYPRQESNKPPEPSEKVAVADEAAHKAAQSLDRLVDAWKDLSAEDQQAILRMVADRKRSRPR